jgi:hypothetical protein
MSRLKSDSKSHHLGFGASLLLTVFGRKAKPLSSAELYKQDFHPNTQKMGLHFSDRVRKAFRLRWLRLK